MYKNLVTRRAVSIAALAFAATASRAVTRNAIRRQIHELSRLHADSLPPAAWVVRLRSEFSRQQFVSATSEPLKRAVRAELAQLLGRVLTLPTQPQRDHHAG